MVDFKAVIFTRTYDGDAKWLERTLPLNVERCKDYSDYIVTGIYDECTKVREICDKNGVRFVPHNEARLIANGYINQQYTKMIADLLAPNMDYILYCDADTYATEENTPADYFIDHKPYMLLSEWDKVGQAVCWKAPTHRAIGVEPTYEFMRRLPMMYPRVSITKSRSHIESIHRMGIGRYLSNQQQFSEFNAIGAWAYRYEPELFRWINAEDDEGYPADKFKQCWSHGDMEEQING